jgi:hypothetical protein
VFGLIKILCIPNIKKNIQKNIQKNNFYKMFYVKTNSWFLIWVDPFNFSKMKIKRNKKVKINKGDVKSKM